MDAYHYGQLEDSLDYLFDFFDQDLAQRVHASREYVPAGMEEFLGDNSLEDFVWLWVKEPGANGFRQYLRDGGYDEAEVAQAFLECRTEWGMNTLPHIEWLHERSFATPVID
ncbi:MAG: hypothetical protein ACTH7R_08935 [Corynebacterium flavescens]|uniref:hypothetical protein n=1 Tax=Corynebacterium TaxID=1716 RepID=UPI0025808028|nr:MULTISPECIES: hypothetical protein [Corynebacterium]